MKKKILLILGALICLVCLPGCKNSDEESAKKTASKFTEQFYNIDVNSAKKMLNPTENIISAHDKFKEYMMEDEYNAILSSRKYIRNLNASVNNGCSFKIKNIKFDKRFYDKNESKFGFDYAANIEVTYDKDLKKESVEEKGYVGLVKENNKWKIYSTEIAKDADVFINKK